MATIDPKYTVLLTNLLITHETYNSIKNSVNQPKNIQQYIANTDDILSVS